MLTSPAGDDFSRLFQTFDFASRRIVIAAVSGGSDSTALLLLLRDFLDRFAPATMLAAATVDHDLRSGSAVEAQGVGRLCAGLGIPHRILTWTGAKPSSGVPAAAREARHRFLAQAARDLGADLVLTGHTADDQAETVLMRRAREAGRGLAGIAPATLFENDVWFARPLLDARRAELRAFLGRRGVGWVDDPTNADPAYERPRQRLALGGDDGSRQFNEALRIAAAAALAREVLGEAAARLIEAHASQPAAGLFRLDPAFLDAEGAEAAIYALRILLAVVGGAPHLPDAARSAAFFAKLRAAPAFRDVLSRTLVDRRRGGIFLLREARGLPAAAAVADGMVWDGRFRVSGDGVVGALGAERAGAAEVGEPASLVRAALATQPRIVRAAPHPPAGTFSPYRDGEKDEVPASRPASFSPLLRGEGPAGDEGRRQPSDEGRRQPAERQRQHESDPSPPVAITPILAPWARFLPSFDLAPARAVSALVGAAEIPLPPFRRHNGRKA